MINTVLIIDLRESLFRFGLSDHGFHFEKRIFSDFRIFTPLHTSYVFFNKLEILNVVLFLLQCCFLKVHFCSPIIVFV